MENKVNILREKAEAHLKSSLEAGAPLTTKEVQAMLHDLQVHQIELEIQNEELREMQQRLEESRDQYSDLFEFAPLGYFILNKDGLILNCNITGSTLLGHERQYLDGRPFALYATTSGEFRNYLFRVFQSKNLHTDELELKRKGQAAFTARLSSVMMEDATGSTSQCRMSVSDISGEKKTAQLQLLVEQLRLEKERAQYYLELGGVMFVALDLEGNISMLNQSGQNILGYQHQPEQERLLAKDKRTQRLTGENWSNTFLAEEDQNLIKRVYQQLLKKELGAVEHYECKVRTKSNQYRHIAWCGTLLADEDGAIAGTLHAGIDITERKKAEAQLHEIEAQTLEAVLEGLEQERSRIAADLHDSVNPLLSMARLNAETLMPVLEKNNKPSLQHLTHIISHLENAMEEIKAITRNLSPALLKDFGLQKALEDLCSHMENTGMMRVEYLAHGLKKRLKWKIELTLYRIAQEILNNIARHAQATLVEIQLIRHKSSVVLMVMDNGVGFDLPAEEIKNNGLGLKNIYSRVKTLHGTLNIDSAQGQGTTITVELPL